MLIFKIFKNWKWSFVEKLWLGLRVLALLGLDRGVIAVIHGPTAYDHYFKFYKSYDHYLWGAIRRMTTIRRGDMPYDLYLYKKKAHEHSYK